MKGGEIVRRVRPLGSPESLMDEERPKVYAVPQASWKTGDISGSLLLDNGEVPWSHISSGEHWLLNDLTTSFRDRAERLLELYPDGYDVVWVDGDGQIPDEVLTRNEARGQTMKEEAHG